LQRSGVSEYDSRGNAVYILHLNDRRRCAGDQGLSVQPAGRAGQPFQKTRRRFHSASAWADRHAFNIGSKKAAGFVPWRDDDIVSYPSTGHAAGHGAASRSLGEAVDHGFSTLAPGYPRIGGLPAHRASDAVNRFAGGVAAARAGVNRDGCGGPNARGKMVLEGARVSYHDCTDESLITPFATLADA
jgi:hypothetical protein